MKTRILLLDENQETLDAYLQALGQRRSQWEIAATTSIEEAFQFIAERPPSIVVAGAQLKGSNGPEFLAEVERRHPDAQRFIAATEEEKSAVEPASGCSFGYLPKPCPSDRLITEFQRCLAIDTWLGNPKIKEIIAKMGEFPSLPPVYLKVVNALNARDASTADIGHAIAGDIAISAKLLQVVNSSYYGFDDKISDISEAVSILGLETVKHLVLAIQVFGKLGRTDDQKALVDQLWHHSMSVAVAAKRIMKFETGSEKASEEAYTAGLLHDIGKLVMITAVPEAYAQARAHARARSQPIWQSETEIIGCNHAETGAYLLGRWGMPAALVEAVALHHEPVNSSGTYFSALSAVHVANALVWERHPGDQPHPDASPDEGFLVEIGRGSSWAEWRDIASGKQPATKAEPAPKAIDAAQDAAPADAPFQSPTSRTTADEPKPARRPALTIAAAIAACAALAAGLRFLAVPDSEPAPEPIRSTALAEAQEVEDSSDVVHEYPQDSSEGLAVEDLVAELDQVEPESPAAPPPELAPEPEGAAVAESAPDTQTAPPVDAADSSPQPILAAAPENLFPEISLAGIFYNPTTPMASVNGQIRRVGDSVSGATIVRIEAKAVVVSYNGESRSFRLK